jgi:hypothetical protein
MRLKPYPRNPGKHTKKQRRQAMHIAASERKRGVSPRRALEIGWATVTKQRKQSRTKGRKRMAMPPALARWHRQHGHHKHKHHGGHKRKSSSTAMVRYTKPSVTVVRFGATKPAKKRHHRRHHGGGGARHSIGAMAMRVGAGALWGWATDVKKLDILDKIPKLGGLPKQLIVGAALELTGLTRRGLGPIRSSWIDQIATAGLYIGGNEIGKANFKLSGDDD